MISPIEVNPQIISESQYDIPIVIISPPSQLLTDEDFDRSEYFLPPKTNTLIVGPFEYTLTLYNNCKTIKIEIVHLGEFHQWKTFYHGPNGAPCGPNGAPCGSNRAPWELNEAPHHPDISNKQTVLTSMSSSSVAIELTPKIVF